MATRREREYQVLDRIATKGYRNFATKLWNAARFAEMNQCVEPVTGFEQSRSQGSAESLDSRRDRAGRAQRSKTALKKTYRFNEAAQSGLSLHLEYFLQLASGAGQAAAAGRKRARRRRRSAQTIAFVLERTCKLPHPFMPFLTEELWAITRRRTRPRDSRTGAGFVAGSEGAGRRRPPRRRSAGWSMSLSQVRSVRAEMNVPAGAQIRLVWSARAKPTSRRAHRWGDILKRTGPAFRDRTWVERRRRRSRRR